VLVLSNCLVAAQGLKEQGHLSCVADGWVLLCVAVGRSLSSSALSPSSSLRPQVGGIYPDLLYVLSKGLVATQGSGVWRLPGGVAYGWVLLCVVAGGSSSLSEILLSSSLQLRMWDRSDGLARAKISMRVPEHSGSFRRDSLDPVGYLLNVRGLVNQWCLVGEMDKMELSCVVAGLVSVTVGSSSCRLSLGGKFGTKQKNDGEIVGQLALGQAGPPF
jgi:hypothetical protein